MAQKPALGKGLASLFPSSPPPSSKIPPTGTVTSSSAASALVPSFPMGSGATVADVAPSVSVDTNRDRHMGISMVSLDEIQANHFQPRRDFDDHTLEELAQSIRSNGIIQPLVVRKNPKDGYELIAGERRLRAARIAGLKQVPIVIRRSTDKESLEIALIENIQRQNLNCIDEALAYFQLLQDFSLTQEEVADRVGKDRATVANYLRLLRLPETIIEDLKKQILTFGHGKALLGLDDVELRLRARNEILDHRLSVRETEALVEALKKQALASKNGEASPPLPNPKTSLAQRLNNLGIELARSWSTRVEVKGSERKGKIVIHYSNRQELDRIIERMQTDSI